MAKIPASPRKRLTRRPKRRLSDRLNDNGRLRAPLYADLKTYLALSGDTQVEFAKRNKTSQSYVSRVARGQIVPRPTLAERLARDASIPLDSFVRVNLAWRAEARHVR